MASLNDLYIKEETLDILLKTIRKKGEKGISLTVSINDEANQWGQNLSAYVSQSKEDRVKKDRFYVGNGKTFWTDGKIAVAEKKAESRSHRFVYPVIGEPRAITNQELRSIRHSMYKVKVVKSLLMPPQIVDFDDP